MTDTQATRIMVAAAFGALWWALLHASRVHWLAAREWLGARWKTTGGAASFRFGFILSFAGTLYGFGLACLMNNVGLI